VTGRGRKPADPFWRSVSSFTDGRVFVLPGWVRSESGPGSGRAGSPSADRGVRDMLESLSREVAGCTGCRLSETRQNLVFGEGNPEAGILLIGEGPGATEDSTGRPFVGRAGKLLDRILAAIDLDRGSVYIANVVKCRPPGNRTPAADEVEACSGILREQISVMDPGVIVALGASAAKILTGSRSGIGSLRGSFHRYGDIPVLVTYHPAALLRSEPLKRPVWEDMKRLKAFMDETGLPRGRAE
jgi:uracil-DNA glycosylase family 4